MSRVRRPRRTPYRAALVGCGRVGFLLERDPLRPKPCTHAGGVAAHPNFRLVAGCDINADRLADFGQTYGIDGGHLYTNVDDLLREEKLDMLSVATWTESHDGIVRKACRAGVAAVICEKPMAVTYRRAKSMAAAVRRSGALLIINHSRRWSPEYSSVRKAILENRYGRLRHIQGCVLTSFGLPPSGADKPAAPTPSWHAVLEKSGGGPLLHDGTHLFDIVFFLTGLRPAWVECRIDRPSGSAIERRTIGRIMFRGNRDLEFCFEAGGGCRYFHFEIELWFDAGRITVGNGIRIAETCVSSRRYSGFRDLSPDPNFPWEPNVGTAERVGMSELSDWFSGGDPPQNTATEALLSQEAIFAAYESAVRGRRIAFPYRSRLVHPLLVRRKNSG